MVHVDLHFKVAELAVAQQNPAVAGARRVLLADDCAVFDEPFAAGAVADALRVFVPAIKRLAVEELDPFALGGVRLAKRQRGESSRGGGGFLEEITT